MSIHYFEIELIPLEGTAYVMRTAGAVRRIGFEPAGDTEFPDAETFREQPIHAGDVLTPGDHLTLAPGARLTIRLVDRTVADYVAPWERERGISFVQGGEVKSPSPDADILDVGEWLRRKRTKR